MKKLKDLKVRVVVIFLAVFVILGFALMQDRNTATASQNIEYCLAMKSDGKIENAVSVKPCTPSGWWCTSNSQCCSGSCRNNVCD